MIPIKLEIQGLYSYREKQVIEFDQLTASGLFGIFGAVGSGKSSILEAILLALYGSTERLSDRGEKNSMVNLQSESLLITFEFLSGKNNTQSYVARYSTKRNPKNFDDVRPAEHTFYKKSGQHLEPLIERAEEIVGMKKEHFKQTVIIPQGKFREFIDLTPGPRAEMMKELFGLERFDLAAKTGGLLRVVKDEKIRLDTQLSVLVEIRPELIAEKEILIKETANQVGEGGLSLKNTESVFKSMEILQVKNHQLKDLLKEWDVLELKLPEIEKKKSIWKEFLKAKTYLKPVWEQINEKNAELEKYRVSVIDCTRFKDNFIHEINELEREELELKEKASKKSERETKIRDLKKVIEIKILDLELKAAEKIIKTLKPDIEYKKSSLSEILGKIKKLEEEYENLHITDNNALAELKGFAKDWNSWEEQLELKHSEITAISKEVKNLEEQIARLRERLPASEPSFDSWVHSKKLHIQKLEIEKEKLVQKAGLALHVHLLKEGENCPLCGSKEHPQPLMSEKDNQTVFTINQKIEEEKEQLELISTWNQTLSEQKIRLDNQLDNKAKIESEIQKLSQQLASLKQTLQSYQVNSKAALQSQIQNSDFAFQQRENLLQQIKVLRKKWEDEQTVFEKEEKLLREAEQGMAGLSSKLLAKKEEIKDLEFCKSYFEKDRGSIDQSIQKVLQDIEETDFKLSGKQKVLLETRSKQATNLANLKNFEDLTEKTTTKIYALEKEFNFLKHTHGFDDDEILISLFHHSLDADKVAAEIRQFEDRSLLVGNKIQELRLEPGISEFSQEEFSLVQTKLREQKESLENIRKAYALLDQEINTLKIKLEEKQKLHFINSQLENRESNLKELEKLFKGSGFVKYVSSIYLKELCATANLRFLKLTKNSLSLEIDDNNTFWVIDYLNGGKRRLLKTLSGGQTFQASLCLALALAEKVKSLNQADQSFFFLDEGFGALDRNSLRVVFETLKSLRQENRIVGIISHVEELQQEIEVYAKVELDPERGSQVGYSF